MRDGYDYIEVITTTGTAEEARKIAEHLVENRLAACVSLGGPVESCYVWKGKVEREREWTCTVKTVQEMYQSVEDAIRELHSYEVPQIMAVPVVKVFPEYGEWMRQAVSS